MGKPTISLNTDITNSDHDCLNNFVPKIFALFTFNFHTFKSSQKVIMNVHIRGVSTVIKLI